MITIKNVTLRRSAKVLLEGANVTLNPGEKVGLVGRNGAARGHGWKRRAAAGAAHAPLTG